MEFLKQFHHKKYLKGIRTAYFTAENLSHQETMNGTPRQRRRNSFLFPNTAIKSDGPKP